MINSTYSPQRWIDVEASKIKPHVIGIAGTISFGTTQNTDTLIADDCLIRGIEPLVKNALFGDTITIQVIDKDGVYFPANTVISTPVSNYNVAPDFEKQGSYLAAAPIKILGGLYIRVTYTSTGLVNVNLGVNLLLEQVLV